MGANQYLNVLAALRDRVERASTRIAQAQTVEAQAKDMADRAAAALDAAPDDPHATARARVTLDQAKLALAEARTAREEAEAAARGTHRALIEHEAQASAALNDSIAALRAAAKAELDALDIEWTASANALLAVAAKAAALQNAVGVAITVRSGPAWVKTPQAISIMGESVMRMLDAVAVPKFGTGGYDTTSRIVDIYKVQEAGRTVAAFGGLAERHTAIARLAQVAATAGQKQAAE